MLKGTISNILSIHFLYDKKFFFYYFKIQNVFSSLWEGVTKITDRSVNNRNQKKKEKREKDAEYSETEK